MVKQMLFLIIYQMVEKYEVSESVRLAGKSLIEYLGVFCRIPYIKISILRPKSDFVPNYIIICISIGIP